VGTLIVYGILGSSLPTLRLATDTTVAVEPQPHQERDGLQFTTLTDGDSYAPGDVAKVTVVLSNSGALAVDVYSPDSCDFAFYVIDEGGALVYHVPFAMDCLMMASSVTLAPGDSYAKLVAIWDLTGSDGRPLSPGQYTVFPSLFHAEVGGEITEVTGWSFYIST
jgi:hypothetical protein